MSADPPAMSPTNSSALSDLSRSASPVIDKPHPPSGPQSPSKPPSSTANQRAAAPAAQSPPPLARRESHDSDVSAHSDGSSSLTNLSDEQPEADADEDGDNENEDENDGDSDAKDAPTPEPVIKTPKRSFVPDAMWGWAAKKSNSKSKSKSKDTSDDEHQDEELESEEAVDSDGSDHADPKGEDDPEVSVESTVDNKTRARANSVVSRPRTNSLAKDLAKLKADEGSGSNDTPAKSPSLSEISDAESNKEDEAKQDDEVDIQMDEDHEPAEQEAAAPVVVIEAFDRMEGMETLTALEVALAMTRDYLYNTKMQHYVMEEEALNAGTHPELLHQYWELERRKEARLAIAEKKYQAALARTRRKRQEDANLVMSTWRYERDELQRAMTDVYIGEKRALEREKANLERYSSPRPVTPPMPTEFVEEPPKKRVKVEKLIRSVTAKNVRKNIESALSYPSVDGVSADDLDADLIAMGVRGKPVESGLGLLPPMPNGHRELLPIMPQPQPEYHQGMASPMHQQQFTHQAPLHIHHIHPPFTHTHQGHTSHLPPPQSQQGMSHHGPPFSAWAPEPQPAFPAHQHHHHSHLQHNHPPPHMQPLPGLPQHMQSQGPPQPPSGHRMNYMPSQSTTHTVMQAVERPPSSHMHVSNNAQPFTMSGPPPNTWNEIRKDRDPAMNSPSGHRHGRRSSPMPPHQSQTPHSHRDQSMFPPQLPPQGPPMHSHGPTQGPPPSHIQSHSARPGPPPPPLEQRRSGEHRSSKSTSSKRKAEDEPDMRREAKRPELSGPSSNSRSTNVSPQDQRRDPARSLPSFSVVPPHQQHTASILKERAQPWDQATNPQQTSGIHNHARHGTQGSPNGPPPNGPMAHNSLPPPSQNRQHNSSSQMYSSSDYGRPQAQKSTPLPSAMFQSHSPSQTMQRPPSMMGTHGRPPSPPPAMRRPNITPPHQHSSHTPSSAAGSRSPGKPAYGPPLPPQSQPGPGTQTPTSAGSSNHLRSSGGPGAGSSNSSRGYGLPKSSSGPSLSTMGPPLPSMNSMNESPRMERPPPSSNSAGPVPPPVPVPVPPPTQLPPVQKYGHGLASRLFPSTGLGGAPAGGRSTSG